MGAVPRIKSIWGNIQQNVRVNSVWNVSDAGAPVNGTSGSGAGVLGPGSTYTNTTDGSMYVNVGTLLSPVWIGFGGAVANTYGMGSVGVAKVTYDFAVDGGVVGAIIPSNSPTLPANAIIIGGVLEILTTLTSGGSATIAVGTSAGSSAASLKAATAVASWTAGFLAIIPLFTAASYLKLSAAGRPNITVAVADLTAGKFDLNLLYVIGG